MDRFRYLVFNQRSALLLGVVQVACAAVCLICGCMDAAFRRDTPLSSTRTPVWGGLVMAWPGVLALFASQRKHSVLVSVMVAAAVLSWVSIVFTASYACLTLTYGEEDQEVFLHNHHPEVRFVLHRMVKGANATVLLCCVVSLLLSGLIAYTGCRSLPLCACYDSRTGLETLVPQSDPGDTEMVCRYRAADDDRLFNSPPGQAGRRSPEEEEEEEGSSRPPPYSRIS